MKSSIFNFAFIFGLIIAAVGICILLSQFIRHRICTEQTQGIIVAGDFLNREAALMLTFTVNGEDYRQPFGGSTDFKPGDIVTVVYNPSKINRYNCYILEDKSSLRTIGIICVFGGIVFMLIGFGVYKGWFIETKHFPFSLN